MKPLPAQHSASTKAAEVEPPSAPPVLSSPPVSYSKANRRASGGCGSRAYPWLLAASTIMAGIFCLLYITKPVIVSPQPGARSEVETTAAAKSQPVQAAHNGLMPDRNRLPGEKAEPADVASASRENLPLPGPTAPFEQTNLRVQHILTAEGPGGVLAKIDLDVPVLYQSRNLRWTAAEVAEARSLLTRLSDYQEKSRAMRLEGADLLDSWNRLIARSIPTADLRADSPTLPTNQQDAADVPRPAGLDTAESIKIQPAGK